MQRDPRYHDAPREVTGWLARRLDQARQSGIAEEAVALDLGIGFGKTLAHNLELIARLDEVTALGRPVVVGVSRKASSGSCSIFRVDQRLEAGLAAAAVAVFQGAAVIRAHDVGATRRAVTIAAAIREARARTRAPSC